MVAHSSLFRKDLEHEGQVVRVGEKHVLSANIWAHRKRSGQALVITFPLEADEAESDHARSGGAALLAAANVKAYCMSADDAGGMLAHKVEWSNRVADDMGAPRPPVVAYECIDTSRRSTRSVWPGSGRSVTSRRT